MTTPDVLPRATEHIDRDGRADRDAARAAATPTGPTTARSSSGSPRGRRTGGWRDWTRSSCGSASGSRPTSTPRTTSATSRCGRARSPASRAGRPSIGAGRPGWHIECSAMSMAHLGPSFDIHTGGVDLIFPHHEDEIAQSEAATGEPFVRTWLHCAHLQMGGAKMAKSTGNIARVGELLAAGVSPRALRYALIAVHYRARLDYSDESLAAAGGGPRRGSMPPVAALEAYREDRPDDPELPAILDDARSAFGAALDDDLNVSAGARRASSTWSASSTAGSRRDPSRRPMRNCAGHAARPRPGPGRAAGRRRRPRRGRARDCSTNARRRALLATGRARTDCATSSRIAGSPSRTRATASAGAASWRAAVADRPRRATDDPARRGGAQGTEPGPRNARGSGPGRPPSRAGPPARSRPRARERAAPAVRPTGLRPHACAIGPSAPAGGRTVDPAAGGGGGPNRPFDDQRPGDRRPIRAAARRSRRPGRPSPRRGPRPGGPAARRPRRADAPVGRPAPVRRDRAPDRMVPARSPDSSRAGRDPDRRPRWLTATADRGPARRPHGDQAAVRGPGPRPGPGPGRPVGRWAAEARAGRARSAAAPAPVVRARHRSRRRRPGRGRGARSPAAARSRRRSSPAGRPSAAGRPAAPPGAREARPARDQPAASRSSSSRAAR